MVGPRFGQFVRALPMTGSRRGLLRLFAALPLAGELVILLEEQAQGNVAGVGGGKGRRQRRRARRRHNPGNDKDNRKGKRTRNRQCATAGQTLKKGKRKRCCPGLVLDVSGRCAAPVSPPVPPPVTPPAPPPVPPTCGTGAPCLVFVTSTTHLGSLGGLTGADAICQQRALAASLPGTYKAWLSDSTQSPATRFVQSPGPYRRVDGVTIAANWADLTDGTLAAPITVAETGAVFDALILRSWTHTLANGTAGGVLNVHCNNWTTDSNGVSGDEGQVAATNDNWTDFGSGTCNNDFHLYCFQQS
jgi:hypothetical protein